MSNIEEDKRYFIQLSLEGAKHYLHPVSQLIQNEGIVPIFENLCYALALVRSRQKEHAIVAQKLLKRLLIFHTKKGFPLYLHDFPHVRDSNLHHKVAFVLRLFVEEHEIALGERLHHRLKKHLERYKELLIETPFRSKDLGDDFCFLSKDELEAALEKYALFWHPDLGCYVGPLDHEYYSKNTPNLSLFDYWMASYYKAYPQRFSEKALLQLQASLIPYLENTSQAQYGSYESCRGTESYQIVNTPFSSLFFYKKWIGISFDQPFKGLHLMRYLWKMDERLYHIVCQSYHLQMESVLEEAKLTMIYTYPENKGDVESELEFFMTKYPKLSWNINDQKANTFKFGDTLEFLTPEGSKIEFRFSLEEGEGQFLGHITFGNRPSQLEKGFEAHDIRLFLRTLRRSGPVKVKVEMTTIKQLPSLTQLEEKIESCESVEVCCE